MSEKAKPGFVTSDGRWVNVRAVDIKYGLQLVRQGVLKRMPLPEQPTYSITTVAGNVEVHPHDETTLETDEDKAAWAAYTQAQAALDSELTMATMRYILLEGVVCENPPQAWLDRCQRLGMALPEDPDERLLAYIQMRVLPTPADLEMAMAAIMGVSSAGNQEGVKAAEDMFRGALARAATPFNSAAAG